MPQISAFFYNVNSDRRVDDPKQPFAPGFSDLTFKARFPINMAFFESILNDNNNTFFALQEANDTARDLLKDFFEQKRLTVLTAKYADPADPGSFSFVFAFNPATYDLIATTQFYYTETGKFTPPEERAVLSKDAKISRHCGTEFEKSAQLIRLRHKESNKEILVVNTHPGLEMNHRILAMKRLCETLQNERGIVIAGGDYNQFDSSVAEPVLCMDQIKVLQENGFHWASEGLSKVGLKSTFIGFPFDIARFLNKSDFAELDEIKQDPANLPQLRHFFIRKLLEKQISLFGSCLDAIFTRGLPEEARVSVSSLTMFNRRVLDTTQIEDKKAFQDRFIQHFVEHDANTPAESPIGSDHMALSATIRF